MSVSTNGQICYGLLFEEDYQFPWDNEKYDDGIYDWWLEQCGFSIDDSEYPYTADGDFKPGINRDSDIVTKYYSKLNSFRLDNPIGFELVNVCSAEYPIYILAIKESVKTAHRGYPQEIFPGTMETYHIWGILLHEFCEKYNLEPIKNKPKWYLSSYTD